MKYLGRLAEFSFAPDRIPTPKSQGHAVRYLLDQVDACPEYLQHKSSSSSSSPTLDPKLLTLNPQPFLIFPIECTVRWRWGLVFHTIVDLSN
jgi:hypothetical protein